MKVNNIKKYEPFILWGCYILFLIQTFVSVWTHEPWFDEIHAWQLSKMSFYDIYYQMRYEGHFMLWFLILYPFSHLGFSFHTLGIVSWFFNAISIFFLFWKAPFAWWAKILLLFTFPFSYVNPCISRPYVLIPFLSFLLAYYYSKTLKPPKYGEDGYVYLVCGVLLALLANTHVYSEGFVGIVSLVLLWQTIKNWNNLNVPQKKTRFVSFAIIAIGVLVAFLQVYPSFEHSSILKNIGSTSGTIWQFFVVSMDLGKYGNIGKAIYSLTSIGLLFSCLLFLIREKKDAAAIMFFSCLYMVLVCLFIYGAGAEGRAIMWFYFLLFSLWVLCDCPNNAKEYRLGRYRLWASLAISLFSILMFQPQKIISDYKDFYSGESRFSYFINEHVNDNNILYRIPSGYCNVLEEYLPNHSFIDIENIQSFKKKDQFFSKDAYAGKTNKECIYVIGCYCQWDETFDDELFQKYNYTLLYPTKDEERSYYLQYYLLKVNSLKKR